MTRWSLARRLIASCLLRVAALFSILTPGLLGSPESPRSRFAIPIEKHGDRERFEVLRVLPRPFLLWRTKANVSRASSRLASTPCARSSSDRKRARSTRPSGGACSSDSKRSGARGETARRGTAASRSSPRSHACVAWCAIPRSCSKRAPPPLGRSDSSTTTLASGAGREATRGRSRATCCGAVRGSASHDRHRGDAPDPTVREGATGVRAHGGRDSVEARVASRSTSGPRR